MISTCKRFRLGVIAWLWLLSLVVFALASRGETQLSPFSRDEQPHSAKAAQAEVRTLPALFVSDIHFDPLHDPQKAKLLDRAAVSEWRAILAGPDPVDAEAAFAGIQKSCRAKGEDTAYPLLKASLEAMRQREPAPGFVTVTGDLICSSIGNTTNFLTARSSCTTSTTALLPQIWR